VQREFFVQGNRAMLERHEAGFAIELRLNQLAQ